MSGAANALADPDIDHALHHSRDMHRQPVTFPGLHRAQVARSGSCLARGLNSLTASLPLASRRSTCGQNISFLVWLTRGAGNWERVTELESSAANCTLLPHH